MKIAWLVASLCLASAAASVVPIKGERKAADAAILKKQRQILDLYSGLGHGGYFQNEHAGYDILANADQYSDPTVAKKFMEAYKRGMLPRDAIYSKNCEHVRYQTRLLFELVYTAKDWDTLMKTAYWAKNHLNNLMVADGIGHALFIREDCKGLVLPPTYEIFPSFFVPQETMRKVFESRMAGIKEGRFEYNNSGYEYNFHDNMYGGPLSLDAYSPHNEYKVSYFREDVGLSFYNIYHGLYGSWVNPKKHNINPGYHFRRGEKFYEFHQQLLARYTLERLANGLPYTDFLAFDKPIKVGYNPRVAHPNGEAFITRPDGYGFANALNKYGSYHAEMFEDRLLDAIGYGSVWNQSSNTLVSLLNDDGVDLLGHLAFGSPGMDDINGKYYGRYFNTLLTAIGMMVKTKNMVEYNGGATSSPITALRDPAYYSAVARLVGLFQKLKARLHPYTKQELGFPGVSVTNFEVDKLTTYFEMFDFDITNAVGVKDPKEYKDLRYQASQFRLNHKPYTMKITANSDAAYDGMVRVFIGPKYDSEERVLTVEQQRLAMFEIDRFPVKITAGQNVWERSSKDSNIFSPDDEGIRGLYERVEHSTTTNEPFYTKERVTCAFPERLQLPRGWKSGQAFTFFVIVTPNKQDGAPTEGTWCRSAKLYDRRPAGFPFDRPIWESEFNVPNMYFKDELIYHKDGVEMNRV